MTQLSDSEKRLLRIIYGARRKTPFFPILRIELDGLARQSGLNQHDIVDVSRQLKERGLVKMKRDPGDAAEPTPGVACVELTPRGVDCGRALLGE